MSVAGTLGRLGAVFRLGVRRLFGKVTGSGSNRIRFSVTGIAVAVMLMITVSGVALGLASQTAVQSDNVDYWVVPEGGSLDTIAVSTGGPKLGNTHELAGRLNADARVDYATPVGIQVIPINTSEGQQYVMFVGVIPPENRTPTVAGLPTAPLSPGDPYYAAGDYNGTWTGEAVVNPAAVEILNTSVGAVIHSEGPDRELSVTAVSDEQITTGVGTVPVALVHLSELQTISGSADSDAADQLLVSTDDAGVRDQLDGLYPNTVVVTRTGIASQQVSSSSLPLAMGVAAFVVSLVVGVLFTATMMGLEVTNDRRALGTLAALGYSERSLTVLVVAEMVCLSLLGGVIGAVLGAAGIGVINLVAAEMLGITSLALLRPALLAYGLGVALLIGLLAAPYPIWLSRRADSLAVVRR